MPDVLGRRADHLGAEEQPAAVRAVQAQEAPVPVDHPAAALILERHLADRVVDPVLLQLAQDLPAVAICGSENTMPAAPAGSARTSG